MTKRKILGGFLISVPAWLLFGFVWADLGFITAFSILMVIVTIVGSIVGGCKLLMDT